MDADLYIKPITDAATAKYEPLFNRAVELRNNQKQTLESLRALVGDLSGSPQTTAYKRAVKRMRVFQTALDAAQKKVTEYYEKLTPSSGYFRDSYNGSAVFWRMDLSWWKDAQNGVQTVESLTALRDKVKSRKVKSVTVEELRKHGCKVDDGENSLAVWRKYFCNKKRRLVRFLDRAIQYAAKGEEVYFSL